MSKFTDQDLTHLKAIESVRTAKRGFVLHERNLTGVEQRRLVAKLESDMEKIKSTTAFKQLRRKRIKQTLYAWGDYRNGNSAVLYGGDPSNYEPIYSDGKDGYEHRQLTDHASYMIQVDQVIDRLSVPDNDLIQLEYRYFRDGRQAAWELAHQKSPGRYIKQHSKLLKIIWRELEKIT